MKYAVNRVLDAKKYETADVGSSLKRVLKYWTVRDKFTKVHPHLARLGVTKIEVADEGLHFFFRSDDEI